MPQPAYYEIRIEGPLNPRWSDWFAGLSICLLPDGTTLIAGDLPDQSALHGILMKIRDLNLVLVSVNRKENHDV